MTAKTEPEWTSIRDDVPAPARWVFCLAPGRAPSLFARTVTQTDRTITLREFERLGIVGWMYAPKFPEWAVRRSDPELRSGETPAGLDTLPSDDDLTPQWE